MKRNPYILILRPVNLLIVAVTQAFVYTFLLIPGLHHAGFTSTLNVPDLMMLIFCTCCLAASANIINDIYDADIDVMNKPERTFIPNLISRKAATLIYVLILLAGGGMAVILGLRTGRIELVLLYPAAGLLLWFYSANLKRLPLAGNLLVSAFCAGVIIIVLVPDVVRPMVPVFRQSVFAYAVFAGLITFFRELVKDIEDREGDAATGLATFPIRFGITKAKLIGGFLLILLATTILSWEVVILEDSNYFRFGYILLFVIIPLAYLFRSLVSAEKKADYYRISTVSKAVMVSGSLLVLMI